MAAISKKTVWNTFSWMKIYEFWISLKFVPQGPIRNIPALVQKMARRWLGDKPLPEPMMVKLLMHICVTQPQWVKMVSHLGFLNFIMVIYLSGDSLCIKTWPWLFYSKWNHSNYSSLNIMTQPTMNWWLSARLQYLQCISNGDTAV